MIEDIQKVVQEMQTQGNELEELVQSSLVISSSNSAVMEQLAYMTVIMNAMQAQLKTLASAQTN